MLGSAFPKLEALVSEHKQATRRWVDEVWNNRNAAAVTALMAPNCVVHGLAQDGGDIVGPDGFRKFHQAFLGAFSNLHLQIEDMLEENDRVFIRFTATGTHDGDTFGFPATHRNIRVTGMTVTRFVGDKFVEGWNVFDAVGMLGQLGVMPQGNAW